MARNNEDLVNANAGVQGVGSESPTEAQKADAAAATGETGKGRKRRAPQGPRKVSPLYVFVTVDSAKPAGQQVSVSAQFRDPRKMADHFGVATAEGQQLLVVTPES